MSITPKTVKGPMTTSSPFGGPAKATEVGAAGSAQDRLGNPAEAAVPRTGSRYGEPSDRFKSPLPSPEDHGCSAPACSLPHGP